MKLVMKRHANERGLTSDEIGMKRIVRHKGNRDSPSPEPVLDNRDSRKRSVTDRDIQPSGGSNSSYNKFGSRGKFSHNSSSHRNSFDRSPSVERRRQFHGHSVRHKPHSSASDQNLLDQIDFSLHISNIDIRPTDDEIWRSLFKEFKRFGYISVKVLGYGKERRAFINYQHYDEAKRAKKENQNLRLFNRPIHIEWSKSTLIKYPEISSGRKPTSTEVTANSYVEDYHSTRSSHDHHRHHHTSSSRGDSHEKADHKRDVSFRNSSSRTGSTSGGVEPKPVIPVLDPNATRTLFVGNLELDVTERELRDLFSQYGRIESVDIKVAKSAGTSYSFIKFTTITDAINAKNDMHGRLYGTFRLKIGFGKGSPTGKVWVGNLTCQRDLSEVRHEMDRFGLIRRCDYRDGDNHAYVHFESLEAAQAAVHSLQNLRLRNGQLVKLDIHKPLHMREVEDDYIPSTVSTGSRHRESSDFDNHRSQTHRESDYDSHNKSDDFHHHHKDRVVSKVDDDRNYRKRPRNSDMIYHRVSHDDDLEISSKSKRQAIDYESGKDYHHSKSNGSSTSSSNRKSKGHDRMPNDRHVTEKHESIKTTTSTVDNTDGTNSDDVVNNIHSSLTAEAVASSSMMVEGDTALKLTSSTEPVSPDNDSKGVKPDSTHSETLSELGKSYPVAWRGNLVLKNTGFPARLHLVGGDPSVAEYLLRGKDEPCVLRITQRLRLEQPRLEEVNKRLLIAGPNGHCILFALPGPTTNHNNSPDEIDGNMQLRPLRSLVSYLKQKEAAGIVALNAADIGDNNDTKDPKEVIGVLHAFPPCEFSQAQLVKVIPTLSSEPSKEDHIVVLLVKGNV